MGLDTVFDEVVVAHYVVTDVVLDCQVMDSVEGDDSGHGIMDCVASGKGVRDVSVHVVVDAIATDDARLSALGELSVGDLANKTILGTSGHHQMSTVTLLGRGIIARHFDVPRQQADLSPHVDLITAIGLNPSEVQVLERSINSYSVSGDGSDVSPLSLVVIETS